MEIIFRMMVWMGNVPHRLRYWKPWSPFDGVVLEGYGACRTWSLPVGQYISAGGVWEFIASPHFYLTLSTSRFLLKTNSQVPAAIPPCQKHHPTNKKYHCVPMKQTLSKECTVICCELLFGLLLNGNGLFYLVEMMIHGGDELVRKNKRRVQSSK